MKILLCTHLNSLMSNIYTSGLMSPGWRFWDDADGFLNATRLPASESEREIARKSRGLGVKSTGVDPDFLCLGPSGSYQGTQQTVRVHT